MTERELLKIFSENVKLFRSRNKWTQAELAEKINISINFLSDIENGKKWASPVTIVKLADIFRIRAFELFIPIDIISENINIFMEKYTEDIISAITGVHNNYLVKLNTKKTYSRAVRRGS